MNKANPAEAVTEKEILSRNEAAKFVGVSIRTLDKLINSKIIPSIKLGGKRVFRRTSILAAMDRLEA